MLHYLKRWRNTAYLLWALKMQRDYLKAILAISEEPHARVLAAAALAHSQAEGARMIEP